MIFHEIFLLVANFIKNHATSSNKNIAHRSATILFSSAAAEQKSLKMKNGGHLEAAELKKPRPA